MLKQAKQMEEVIEKLVGPAFLSSFKLHSFCRFLENIDLGGHPHRDEPGKDLEFYAVCTPFHRFVHYLIIICTILPGST